MAAAGGQHTRTPRLADRGASTTSFSDRPWRTAKPDIARDFSSPLATHLPVTATISAPEVPVKTLVLSRPK
eukprot:15455480-Alexandrium_andersonii.AAC.1